MEELLNKLIEKGWKPFGIYTSITAGFGLIRCEEYTSSPRNERKSYRELVNKESGLWQFCCKNGMVRMKEGYYWQNISLIHSEEYDYTDYQYWILESSLIDEDKLEQFLLDNIKIDG